MAINTINKMYTRDDGLSNPVDCPECSHNVAMRLFSTVDTSVAALISKEDKNIAVAVCPRCASVFAVNKNFYREKDSGTAVIMTSDDLTVIVKGK